MTPAQPLAIGIDEGTGPLVVLVHGFPETPVSWHHQVDPLVDAGYRVVAPWLRGYGPSPAVDDPADVTADKVADDLAGVAEALGYEQAVFVGHDWGAASVWATAELRPDRVAAMAALSVPFTARSQHPPLERLAEVFADRFFYMLFFTEPDRRAEAALSGDVRATLQATYATWSGHPPAAARWELPKEASLLDQLADGPTPWLDDRVLDEGVAAFTDHGFTGPLSYYRAMDLTWHGVPAYGTAPVTCPAMFLAGELDGVLRFTPTRSMAPPLVPDLRADVRIPDAGHWVQQESPEPTTEALLAFLRDAAPVPHR
ncbi:MAG TPA: alpha/beta hydrolase [Mycobacteriales bacterium]